jgi:hypothetical protein
MDQDSAAFNEKLKELHEEERAFMAGFSLESADCMMEGGDENYQGA